MRIIGIYKITCLINNKIYIGQSIDCNHRIINHKSRLKRNCDDNPFLQKDYNKYGLCNFKFEVIEKCVQEKLLERETYWINYYGGKNSDILYNELDIYGMNNALKESKKGCNNVMYHKTHSEEAILKIKKANIGRKLSIEHRNKISQSLKNNTNKEEANNSRRKASTKYSIDFINLLKQEYNVTKNYTKIANKYKIQPRVVSNLIKYGTTSRVVISKIKNKVVCKSNQL